MHIFHSNASIFFFLILDTIDILSTIYSIFIYSIINKKFIYKFYFIYFIYLFIISNFYLFHFQSLFIGKNDNNNIV